MDITKFTGFTPGPWKLQDEGSVSAHKFNIAYFVHGASATYVGLVELGEFDEIQKSGIDTAKSNAQLIAHAPELLELARLGLQLAEMALDYTRNPEKVAKLLAIDAKARELLKLTEASNGKA